MSHDESRTSLHQDYPATRTGEEPPLSALSRRNALTAAVSMAALSASGLSGAAWASTPGRAPDLSRVDAEALEAASASAYLAKMQLYAQEGKLAQASDPHLHRLLHIANRMIQIAPRFNPRAARWTWRVNLINDNNARFGALAMAGGQMVFSSQTRQWTDDETAVVMGHEIAHCLLEHSRETRARDNARREWIESSDHVRRWLDRAKRVEQVVRLGGVTDAATQYASNAASMHYRREDEIEATTLGLELSARIGMDPRAAVGLWVPASGSGPRRAGLFETHPTSWKHGQAITERALPQVIPIYEAVASGRMAG